METRVVHCKTRKQFKEALKIVREKYGYDENHINSCRWRCSAACCLRYGDVKYNNHKLGHSSKSFYEHEGYKIMSFGEFLLLEKRIMDFPWENEFVLPEAWYVRVTEENRQTLYDWIDRDVIGSFFREKGVIVGMCKNITTNKISKEWNINNGTRGEDYTFGQEITFEQFKKYVLMKKKIVGYKLKKDCQIYIPAINVIISSQNEFPIGGKIELDCFNNPYSIKLLEKANVLGLWFDPIYKEEVELPEIERIKAQVTKTRIIYGSKSFTFKYIRDLFYLLQDANITAIEIDSRYEVSLKQIRQIVKYLDSNNLH